MKHQWEQFVLEVIDGKRKGIFYRITENGLRLISLAYRAGVHCRNFAHDQGFVACYDPPVPVVISIGNIVAGGTGKTPVTLMLAEELSSEFHLAILSRGYRSPVEKRDVPLILSRGNGPEYSASYCGDEPYLLANRVPLASVYVGKNRMKASMMAAKSGAQVIVLDDGMQHRRVARDYEIVVVNAFDPFGKGHFLPRGLLRESPKALAKADIVVVNNVESKERCDAIAKELKPYTDAPVVGTVPKISSIENLKGEGVPLMSGTKVGLFCGIAHPKRFRNLVEEHGASVVEELSAPDHMLPSEKALKAFATKCEKMGAEYLLCTEKDRVKLKRDFSCALPIVTMNIRLKIITGMAEWENLVKNVKERVTSK